MQAPAHDGAKRPRLPTHNVTVTDGGNGSGRLSRTHPVEVALEI